MPSFVVTIHVTSNNVAGSALLQGSYGMLLLYTVHLLSVGSGLSLIRNERGHGLCRITCLDILTPH